MAKAIRIVSVKKKKASDFHEESLKKILVENEDLGNRKIVPISITGAMRTGKSLMLNYFLRYLRAQYVIHKVSKWLGDKNKPLNGFEWGANVDGVTAGIMMWSEVFLYDSPEHGPLAIVLMDTQGFFDNQTTLSENAVIFALSTIMASVQIYNVMNNFNEHDLQLLQMFADYGKVAMESTGSKPFQKLTILVRDWNPQNGLELGAEGGRNLIERRMEGDSRLKSVREDIYASFDSLDGFLMRHPGEDLIDNSKFDGRIKFLSKKFVIVLKEFVESIFKPENLILKQMHGKSLTVNEYINNFGFYAKFFSDHELPKLEKLRIATSNNNALNAFKSALEEYREKMTHQPENIKSVSQLNRIHETIKSRVLSDFDEKTRTKTEVEQNCSNVYRDQLNDTIEKFYKEIYKKTREVLDEENSKSGPCETVAQQSSSLPHQITPKEFEIKAMNPLDKFFEKILQGIGKIFCQIGKFIVMTAVAIVGKLLADRLSSWFN